MPARAAPVQLNQAQHQLWAANLRLAAFAVGKMWWLKMIRDAFGGCQDDAVQFAALCLARVTRTYDRCRGKFTTYAVSTLRFELLDYANSWSGLVCVPSHVGWSLLHEDMGRPHQVPAALVQAGRRVRGKVHRVGNAGKDEPGADVADLGPGAAEAAQRTEEIALVRRLLAWMPARERFVLRRRFGIGVPAQTLDEISRAMHVSKQRVQQLQKRGLRRLRKELASR